MELSGINKSDLTVLQKLWQVQWLFVLLICAIGAVGVAMLYSAANGSMTPWASRQAVIFGGGLVLMIAVALIDIRLWLRYAYVFYFLVLLVLVWVEIRGFIGMGAQRWIDLGLFSMQPSELMKIAMVVALARYFHGSGAEDMGRPLHLIPPLVMVFVPVALVVRQPDLGTALMIVIGAAAVFFLAGVRMWKFGAALGAVLVALPVLWQFMRPYQKNRVLMFLNPERDPLGAGYNIIQSKIALGSGGLFGKGFLLGTQSHLNYLPEKHTDFIFTMFAEEFGLMGGLGLIGLYVLAIIYGFAIAMRSRHQFGRLVGMGVVSTFFLYVFINIAMVMGLIPVVGAPLALISYGGSAMMTLMLGFGLLLSVFIHRDVAIGRRGGGEA